MGAGGQDFESCLTARTSRTLLALLCRTEKRTLTGMNIVNASEAREKLYRLLDETATDHEPVLITGPRSNAVLDGEEDWNAIQESLHLLSVPGILESVLDGLATPTDRCETEPGW